METKFRPVPLSIIDFFGVVVPGFLWLVLLVTAAEMVTSASAVTPVTAWRRLSQQLLASGEWLGPLVFVFASFLIGYAAKPRSMTIATRIAARLIRAPDRRFKEFSVRELEFPFPQLHEGREYYKHVLKLVTVLTDCQVTDLPGPQPFTVTKQFLRLAAPALWEQLEHREAEIRLLGVTVLAAVFSTGLSVAEIIRHMAVHRQFPAVPQLLWLVASVVATMLVAQGFVKLRIREVDHAYLSALIAMNTRKHRLLDATASPQSSIND